MLENSAGNTDVSQKERNREVEKKKTTWEHERVSPSSGRVQSTGSVIISWFGVFWMDQYKAGRHRVSDSKWNPFITQAVNVCAAGSVAPSEARQTERDRTQNKERVRMSEKRSSAVPSPSFYRKGSGDRRRRSWHTAAWGSTASHSSPLPVGTQTSWYTFRRKMNNSHQPLLHIP